MVTDLNKLIDKYMSTYSLEEISKNTIEHFFKGKECTNEYGNILHALVHHKYDEEKVLKMVDILPTLNIDVNFKGKTTGYNFIQLALYGYTKDDKDFPYSTDFILKLIRIAKKYNFNVNVTDKDGDTIIHTALASEVYLGKTLPILKELGTDFDIKKKDNNGNNIYEALLYYKKEAVSDKTKNKKWLERLTEEEQEIKRIVEIGQYTLSDIDEKLEVIKLRLNELTDNLDIEVLFANYNEIVKKLEELKYFLEKRSLFKKEQTVFHNLQEEYKRNISLTINNYLKSLLENPIMRDIETLEKFLKVNSFVEELGILTEAKQSYVASIEELKLSIDASKCLAELSKLKFQLTNFVDSEVKQELLKLIENQEQFFNKLISDIGEIRTKRNLIENWIVDNNIIDLAKKDEEDTDFTLIEKEELLKCHKNESDKILHLKQISLEHLESMINPYSFLVDNNFTTKEEIQETVLKTLKKEPKSKNKFGGRK